MIKIDSLTQKKKAILEIFEFINTVFIENINEIYNNNTHNNIILCIKNCNAVKKYANTQLVKISINYFQTVSFLDNDFYVLKKKINKHEDVKKFLKNLSS